MFRKVSDFLQSWKYESESTLKLFSALTDESLQQKVTETGRSLGFIAWHITVTPREMLEKAGLIIAGPLQHAPVPLSAQKITEAYKETSASAMEITGRKWKDEDMTEEVDMYGDKWNKGTVLQILIKHGAHHRGQMTVLMRQAGLIIPGVYGPAKEEWAAWGMPSME